MRIKPVFGTVAGILCVTAWIGATIGDVLQSAEDATPTEIAVDDFESQLVPTVLVSADDNEKKVTEMTDKAVALSQSYEVGEATCQATLAHVDECLGALQTEYASCQNQPYWESCQNQLMQIRSDLPCCGGSAANGFIDGGGIVGEHVIPGSEQVISEQVISEQVVGPVPMDQACLPSPPPIAFGPEPIAYGGGCCGGGGGGGGLFGGGNLLGLAALGIGIVALAQDDDDDNKRKPATPNRY